MSSFYHPRTKGVFAKVCILITAFCLLNAAEGFSQTVTKTLYLSHPSQGLDRSNPANPVDNTTATSTTIGEVVVSGNTVQIPTTSFTMGTPLCSALTLAANGTITVETFINILTGSLTNGSNYFMNAVLKWGATSISLFPANYSSAGGGKLTWTGVTGPSAITIPAGQAITLDISIATYPPGVSFAILYDSDTKPSRVNLPVTAASAITISSYAVYDAPAGGNMINTAVPIGTTVYPRVVVSDPFGFDDITGLSINIPGTGNVEATSVATSGCTKTYQYAWTVSGSPGSVSIPATAREGTEGTVTAVQPLTVTACTPVTTPVFTAPASNTRCRAAGTVTYTATSSGSVAYSLDAVTLAYPGNSINAASGVVTYAANWSGTSTITATATGCGPLQTAMFTTNTIGRPVFASGSSSSRCAGAAIVGYPASVANATVIYSLTPSGTGPGQAGVIDVNTGTVTYNAAWAGNSVIIAAPAGCASSPATHIVSTTVVTAVPDVAATIAGAPVEVDVLANDLCDKNPFGITIFSPPTSGTTVIANGKITYIPSGNTTYTDVFTYRVCSINSPGICSNATVTISVTASVNDICADSKVPKTFYLPFPESNGQLKKALLSAGGNPLGSIAFANARSILSIKVSYPGEVIYYDQWEDGYESNIQVPNQSTTQVWGDGNTSNGIAPGYATDIIPAGGFILIDNLVPFRAADNASSAGDFYYDGRDKIYSTADIEIAVAKGEGGRFNNGPIFMFDVQSVKSTVVDIARFGKSFTIPFGENISDIDAFRYTSMFVRASQNNTQVQLDYDADGTIDQSKTLNEGEVWFYDGTASTPGAFGDINQANDIKSGGMIFADKPVGVDLVFGGIDTYGTRNISLLPAEYYGNTYYTPVYNTQTTSPATAPVKVYFTNTLNTPVTVAITTNAGSQGTLNIPAKGYTGYTLAAASGYKFASTGGQSFTAISIQDADLAGSNFDWAFNMIPEERLGNFVSTAWAPGGNPVSPAYNYTPVWVTPVGATTFYVKYDGNISGTGLLGNSPVLGLPYDLAVPATTLSSYRIVNPGGDNSGMAVFTENGVKFAGVWGQDPERTPGNATPGSSPGQDIGYVLTPKCLSQSIFAGDDFASTPLATPVNIAVLSNDAAFLGTINPSSVTITEQPKNGTVVVNPGGSLTYTPNTGFTGKDTLVYNVCLLDYPSTCDVATVIITVTDCSAGSTQTVISGKVTVDLTTPNGITDPTDPAPRTPVKVELYVDADCSGTVNGAEAVSQTTFSDFLGNYSFTTTGKKAADEFAAVAYTNNNGNINWTTSWTETGETTDPAAGQVTLGADPSGSTTSLALQFQGNASTTTYAISRSLQFVGGSSALLQFRFRRQGFNNGSEGLLVTLNGNTIYTINNGGLNGTDPNYTSVSLPLSGFLPNGVNTIGFAVNGSSTFGSTEVFFIDGVEISYGPSCYIVKVNPAVPGNPYTASAFSSANTKIIPATGYGTCVKNQNLLVTTNLVTSNDYVTTPIDVPVTIPVLANDIIGTPDSTTVVTGLAGYINPANGTVAVNANGTIQYTPNPGFSGTDFFQYRVCSAEDPGLCDSSIVVITIACAVVPGNYTIGGIVFNDANNSASLTPGEVGLALQQVNLYVDANNNNLMDGAEGTAAFQTTTTSNVGAYTFNVPQTGFSGTYLDQFNTNGSGAGTNGTGNWINQWLEIGESNGFNTNNIVVENNALTISGAGNATVTGASRVIPMLVGSTGSFQYSYVESGLDNDPGDFVQVQISVDGTTNWVTLFTHTGTDGNQNGISPVYDISAYMSTTTVIRFVSSGSTGMGADDEVRFDNVQIGYGYIFPAKYIVQLGQPLAAGYTLTTPAPHPTGYLVASMTQSSQIACSQNFGLVGYITLKVKVLLQGAILGNATGEESIMRDNLRVSPFNTTNYIPLTDPYTHDANYTGSFTAVGDGTSTELQTIANPATMFAGNGNASAVDWIFIELRSKSNPAIVLGTRSAIVQRDGTVVDVDGSSCVRFPNLLNDAFYVAIRHRNHLGVMTAAAVPAANFGCVNVVDFTTMTDAQVWHNPATPQYDGLEMATVTNTVTNVTLKALWAGNANADNKVKYQGGTNDRTLIQSDVVNYPANTNLNINYDLGFGYYGGDINMDSKVKYQGGGNDRTILQSLVLGYLLNATLNINYDLFLEQLP
ncbi:MAG: Ig-like domain-containing protein [Bacteroidota bacterium]